MKLFVFLIVFAIASLYYIANNLPEDNIQEGFEDIEEKGVEENGVIHWLNTKELYDKLKEDYKNKKLEIETIQKTEPKDMYKSDLVELKKKLK
jgi:hypothetical protein